MEEVKRSEIEKNGEMDTNKYLESCFVMKNQQIYNIYNTYIMYVIHIL